MKKREIIEKRQGSLTKVGVRDCENGVHGRILTRAGIKNSRE